MEKRIITNLKSSLKNKIGPNPTHTEIPDGATSKSIDFDYRESAFRRCERYGCRTCRSPGRERIARGRDLRSLRRKGGAEHSRASSLGARPPPFPDHSRRASRLRRDPMPTPTPRNPLTCCCYPSLRLVVPVSARACVCEIWVWGAVKFWGSTG